MALLGFVIGLLIFLGCGCAIYYIVNLIITGAFQQNWLMVVAGGILGYFFIGLLIIGVILGVLLMLMGLLED